MAVCASSERRNLRNSAAAALFADDWVSTTDSPPTTEMLPPSPAGTGAVCRSKSGYWVSKIGYIHGPSRMVAYWPEGRPSEVGVPPWEPRSSSGTAPCWYRSTSSCTPSTEAALLMYPVLVVTSSSVMSPPALQIHGSTFHPWVHPWPVGNGRGLAGGQAVRGGRPALGAEEQLWHRTLLVQIHQQLHTFDRGCAVDVSRTGRHVLVRDVATGTPDPRKHVPSLGVVVGKEVDVLGRELLSGFAHLAKGGRGPVHTSRRERILVVHEHTRVGRKRQTVVVVLPLVRV